MNFKWMICLDTPYARSMSLQLDLKLIAATIPAIASDERKAVRRRLSRA